MGESGMLAPFAVDCSHCPRGVHSPAPRASATGRLSLGCSHELQDPSHQTWYLALVEQWGTTLAGILRPGDARWGGGEPEDCLGSISVSDLISCR